MDLMVDRKNLQKALRQILLGRNVNGSDAVDFTADRESLKLVATGTSVEIAIEAAEIGSVSIPISVVAKLKKLAATYEIDDIRLRASDGKVRIEGMSVGHEDIRVRKIANRLIDIPQDAGPLDVLTLRQIFTAVEIEDCALGARVLEVERRLTDVLDSAARALKEYGVRRDELKALVEARISENAPTLRKVLLTQ